MFAYTESSRRRAEHIAAKLGITLMAMPMKFAH
jgi:hypothetical protein